MLEAFLLSFGVIFVAELGDKSQLMALTFATRYRIVPILIGITLATLVVHAFSVLLGATVAALIPQRLITLIAALAFFGFAIWTWRGDELDDEEAGRARRGGRSAVIAVGVAFFLAELGDKTMLATITLATREEALGTWLGSTAGMVAADALAVIIGAQLGARLPETIVKRAAAVAFLVFGLILLWQAING